MAARPIMLCADDFALSEGVSRAITDLAHRGRLSATSCMTCSPLWPHLAAELDAVAGRCAIGLHLTLTDQPPLGRLPGLAPDGRLPGVGRLMAMAHAGRLDMSGVRDEVRRQWDAFAAARGAPPDFVDGHQHVHLLPGVRETVLDLVLSCPPATRPWVRVCWEAPVRVVRRGVAVGKALFLSALSLALRRQVARLGLSANDSFRGVHGFAAGADPAPLFARFLAGGGERPLVMCHPGYVDDRLRSLDPVTDQRRSEYDYLASDRFLHDLRAAGRRIAGSDGWSRPGVKLRTSSLPPRLPFIG